jgi:hypothetical protein
LERRGDGVGGQRLLRRKWVGRRFGLRQPTATDQQAPHPALEARQELRDLLIGGRRRRVEGGRCRRGDPRVDAVEHQAVEVDVRVERAAKPLDRGNGARPPPHDPLPGGRPPQPAEDGAQEHAQDGPGEPRIKGEQVTDRHRDGEHPLADGHVRDHAIDEVGGQLTHPPPARLPRLW